jgi:hypothetical protein
MSKISLTGNASGTGTFTLASPNSNSDRTVNLPDAGGDMVLTTATQTLTNKDIVATQLTGDVAAARITTALNASGSAPIYACRAWVNFNGTDTVAIRASGNVSSITDNGTGDYTVNFTTAMPDANYSVGGTASFSDANVGAVDAVKPWSYSASSIRIQVSFSAAASGVSGAADRPFVNVNIFR